MKALLGSHDFFTRVGPLSRFPSQPITCTQFGRHLALQSGPLLSHAPSSPSSTRYNEFNTSYTRLAFDLRQELSVGTHALLLAATLTYATFTNLTRTGSASSTRTRPCRCNVPLRINGIVALGRPTALSYGIIATSVGCVSDISNGTTRVDCQGLSSTYDCRG